MQKENITITFTHKQFYLLGLILIIAVLTASFLWTRAAFLEPTVGPASSDQDFANNIMGANNADNDFNSGTVTPNVDGSIIERLENFSDYMATRDRNDYTYGRGWIASSTGNATTSLTHKACEEATNWEWFGDGNGDGDTIDDEDGICVQTTTRNSANWGGTETADNSYIMDYDCTGSFPTGTTSIAAANSCALCVADCYDGRKDLPDQGSYTSPDTSCTSNEDCYEGPLTGEVLKNWKGTRLPTSQDFLGFCGYKDGGSDYETGCSSDTTLGDYGQMMGRTDECMDLSNSGSYEWLSEQFYSINAEVAGGYACSHVHSRGVDYGNRFRAVFRP